MKLKNMCFTGMMSEAIGFTIYTLIIGLVILLLPKK